MIRNAGTSPSMLPFLPQAPKRAAETEAEESGSSKPKAWAGGQFFAERLAAVGKDKKGKSPKK